MRKFLAAILLAASLPASAGDPWTTEQKALGAAFATAYVLDWRQTIHIASNPERWRETNPLLGEHPDAGRVNRHFAAGAIMSYLILDAVPSETRTVLLAAGFVVEAAYVNRNLQIGIGWGF